MAKTPAERQSDYRKRYAAMKQALELIADGLAETKTTKGLSLRRIAQEALS